jgi:hypothetical protein
MRFSRITAWLLLAASATSQPAAAQGVGAGTRDPFLDDYATPVSEHQPTFEEDVVNPYDPDRQPPVAAWERPAGTAGRDDRQGVQTISTTNPNLFTDSAQSEGGWESGDQAFPPGTQPTQYPLDDEAYRGMPDAYPGNEQQPSWAPPIIGGPDAALECDGAECEPGVIGWKSRKLSLTDVFGGSNSLSIASFDIRGTLEFPPWPGVFVAPQFGWHLLSGPTTTDLPPRLYDASLEFSLWRPVGDAWMLQFSLAPSIFTDGNNTTSDALRIIGRFMAYYTMSPTCQLVGGFVYLDRQDVPALPAAGVIYTPREDLRYELLFPKPRIAWRQYDTADWQQWVYVTGELGGQSWAVERTSGADDIATYRDLRFVLGVERKLTEGATWYAEGGYVFARELEFQSNVGNRSLTDTAFVRLGASF